MPLVVLGRSIEKAEATLADAHKLALSLGAQVPTNGSHQAGLIQEWNNWTSVAWLIETVTENFELKRALFQDLDHRVPAHIPIGTNSSGFPISRIADGLKTRSRMFNAHYFMPAHLVPLVEVALGADSDPELGEAVCALYRRAGKKPVLVRQDIPGLLANRIQHALMREALDLTSVIVSHDVNETLSIADYIYVLANGTVVGEGSPEQLRNSESPFIQQFLHGSAEGPVRFHYPSQPWADVLGA